MSALYEVSLQAGVILVLGLAGAMRAPRAFRWRWLVVGLGLILLHDALLIRLYGLVPHLVSGSRWNWTGKLLAMAGLLAIATLPAFGWKRVGLTLVQAPRSGPAWRIFGIIAVLIFAMAIWFGDGRGDWDSILFQWTMPGIQEELFYRGVLLLALNEAFRARVWVAGAAIGWGGILATVAFGLVHALFFGAEGVSFDTLSFVVTGGPALLLLWFRERTGSLALPIVAHNVANGAFRLF